MKLFPPSNMLFVIDIFLLLILFNFLSFDSVYARSLLEFILFTSGLVYENMASLVKLP